MQSVAGQPVIVGSGLAGLLTALSLAPRPCVLVTGGRLGADSSSVWAQGGLAAAVAADDDPSLHRADTMAAGDGLCDAGSVARLVGAGPGIVALLEGYGVRFDHDAQGRLAVGLEAAHSRRRIVHAMGDSTGAEIVRALSARVRAAPSITVLERTRLLRIEADGQVCAALLSRDGESLRLATASIVLATGGVGGLYRDTTNPLGSTGSGLAAAARAGARLGDLEFVQFHPTALATLGGDAPLPLVSEAVRGEGATLIDETGARFMETELAPRDVVSRAVWHHLAAGHRVFLDARTALGARFATRFPGIDAACKALGIDPAIMPIPVRPAAHYHMGGIAVDADGRSAVPGLYAAGEVACTGLHGANRLASNSLLEAAAGAVAVAECVSGAHAVPPDHTGRADLRADDHPPAHAPDRAQIRRIMTNAAGVLRDRAGLERAIAALSPAAPGDDASLVGLMMCLSALDREESRGGHFRTDHPGRDGTAIRRTLTMAEALARTGLDAKRLAS